MKLLKSKKLNKGDKVATISLSWGGAGWNSKKKVDKINTHLGCIFWHNGQK